MEGATRSIKFPYALPRELAPGLWEIRGEWSNKFGRRMTVIRLHDGRLVIHNAFRLHEPEMNWLRRMGEPAFLLAPNAFHCSDAAWMAEQFPRIKLFAPSAKLKEFARFHAEDNRNFPSLPEFVALPMEGTRIDETAFLHRPSRTLILCDLAFNMADIYTGFEKIFMRWNKIGGRFGPSRLTKLLFAKDKTTLVASYERLLAEDFDRVIVNHGDVLDKGGKAALKNGLSEVFG